MCKFFDPYFSKVWIAMATEKLEGFYIRKTTLAAKSWLSDFPYKSL